MSAFIVCLSGYSLQLYWWSPMPHLSLVDLEEFSRWTHLISVALVGHQIVSVGVPIQSTLACKWGGEGLQHPGIYKSNVL